MGLAPPSDWLRSGVVGYNVQVAVDTEHHLIVTHEVTNSDSDRAQLANVAKQAKAVLQIETLKAAADRGYFNSPEILVCQEAGKVLQRYWTAPTASIRSTSSAPYRAYWPCL